MAINPLNKYFTDYFPQSRGFAVVVPTAAPVQALGQNAQRKKLLIQNTDTSNFIEMVQDRSSALGSGFQIIAGATYIDDSNTFKGEVYLIASTGAVNARVREEFESAG